MQLNLHHALAMAKPSTRSSSSRVVCTPSSSYQPGASRIVSEQVTNQRRHQQVAEEVRPWLQQLLSGAVTTAACLGLLLETPTAAQAEEMTLAFPASTNQEIRRAQQTMVESWAYVQALYLDQSFSHSDWTQALKDALAETYKANSPYEVTQITNKLLSTLGDPYTRLLQGDDAAALTAEEQGKIVATGMGLQPVVLTGLLTNPTNDPSATQPPPDLPQQYENSTSMIAMASATGTTNKQAAINSSTATSSSRGSRASSTAAAASSTAATPTAAAADSSSIEATATPDGPQVLLVSFVVEGSPAEAAGVREGDILLEVQGQPVAGQELRQVYKSLGKESDVTLLRQPELTNAAVNVSTKIPSSSSSSPVLPMTQLPPADASAHAGSSSSKVRFAADLLPGYSPERVYTVHIKPEVLEFAPVQYGIIDMTPSSSSSSGGDSSSSSSVASSNSGPQIGYLKLLTFSATAPQQVAEALIDMQQLQPKQADAGQQLGLANSLQSQQQPQQQQQQEPVNPLSGLIVDLRDNPGGIVEAGVDIAVDFLRRGQVLCVAVDRSGEEERVVLPTAHTLTNLPLVLLVNKNTASTSELVAGALHDELAAPLIGTTTYGKGRTQRVIQLSDGTSTLLVSTMKYFTPKHSEIDGVGLKPDVVCDPPEVVGQRWTGGKQEESVSLLDDPCIKLAAEKLDGLRTGAVAN